VTLQAIARTDASCTDMINNDTVQFCAGYPDGGRDTCKGDSGGPLMLFKNGRWQLIGLTSYGGICGSPGFPGIYTRIAYYDLYIEQIINSNNTFLTYPKQIDVNITSYSNTETFYRKSKIEFVFIFVFILYRKWFFRY
jgi:secreted trypsin-like serine protease